MVTVGGIDTYYDYDEQRWKYRRLGGGPVRDEPPCPKPLEATTEDAPSVRRRGRASERKSARAV